MTQIEGTNREFLELLKGLEAIKGVKGKSFALLTARNIMSLTKHLKPIEKIARPTTEFQKVSEKAHAFAEAEDTDGLKELEDANKELIEQRKEQLETVEKMLDEDSKVKVNLIREELVPDEVTPELILPLLKIIKE